MRHCLNILFLLICIIFVVESAKNRIIIDGVLKCGRKPYKGANVKLIDPGLISQTTVGQTTTGADGSFKIDATFSSAKPVLKIYHKCNRGALSCYMEYSYKVPSNYIFKSDQLIRPLSLNRELSNHTEDEKEVCPKTRSRSIFEQVF